MTGHSNQFNTPPQVVQQPQRYIRNYLLNPFFQLKIAFYSILLTFLFCIACTGALYLNISEALDFILTLTDVPETAQEVLSSQLWATSRWILFLSVLYLLSMSLIAVLYTHKMIGPNVAFKRHVEALLMGDYKARTFLRKGDAFDEVATSLNALSKALEERLNNSAEENKRIS